MDAVIKLKTKIVSIEAIRGFAAIYVLLGHIVQLYKPYSFFPEYEFLIKTLFGYGHQVVILFFIVSGFSIHYSSSNIDFTKNKNLNEYLFKRGRRLYPLFLISLIIAFFVLYLTQMQSDLIRNTLSFFFLTDISTGSIADPIPTNFPIWSLSYEVVYYLLYPILLIGLKKIGLKKIVILSVIISLLSGLFGLLVFQNHLSNVFQLYWTWVIGAAIAEMKIQNSKYSTTYLKGFLVLSIAFMFTLEKLDLLRDWSWAIFFSLVIFSFFSNEENKRILPKIGNLFIGLSGIGICYFLTFSESVTFHPQLLRPILILFAIISLFINLLPLHLIQTVLRSFLKPFVGSGSFSYALYIFHWPLILFSLHLFKDYIQSNLWLFIGTISLNLISIFLLAWYCEVHLQPKIAKRLNRLYYSC